MPKLIYTVMLWYRIVVQSPPAPQGVNQFDKRGEIADGGGGGGGALHILPFVFYSFAMLVGSRVPATIISASECGQWVRIK